MINEILRNVKIKSLRRRIHRNNWIKLTWRNRFLFKIEVILWIGIFFSFQILFKFCKNEILFIFFCKIIIIKKKNFKKEKKLRLYYEELLGLKEN